MTISGQKLRVSRLNAMANVNTFDSLGGCSLNSTSATYVNISSALLAFTKFMGATDSDVIVTFSLSGYTATNTSTIKVGVNLNGADTDAVLFQYSSANIRTTLPTGIVRVSGLAAGGYTAQLRALRSAGTGTLMVDINDSVSIRVEERVL